MAGSNSYEGWLYNGRLFYDPDNDVPDLRALVTGGNSGLGGLELIRQMCKKGARCIMAVRRPPRGEKAAAELRKQIPGAQIDVMQCDMASFRSIKAFVSSFESMNLPLHVLVNNAGEFLPPPKKIEGGFDITLGTNYFGPFFLTHLLLQKLLASAPSRIINVTSVAHTYGYIDWNDLKGESYSTSGFPVYAMSKLMLLMMGKELADRLRGTGIDVFNVHPGVTDTVLFFKTDIKSYPEAVLLRIQRILMAQPISTGVKSLVYAATAQELQGQGQLIGPDGFNWNNTLQRLFWNPYAYVPQWRRRLYERTTEICKEVTASA